MRFFAPLIAGVVVFLALFPSEGVDTQPPECYALLGYVVPCGTGFGVVAAVAAVALVVLGQLVEARRHRWF